MAHFSSDKGLVSIFASEGADPFALLASQWLGLPASEVRWGLGVRAAIKAQAAVRQQSPIAHECPISLHAPWPASLQVTQQQRDHAKQLTYGLLYGMGAAKLADELGCSAAEAKKAQVGQGDSMQGLGRRG